MYLLLIPFLWIVAELLVMIIVAGKIGALATIALLVLAVTAGIALIRGQHLSMIAQMAAGGQRPEAMREGGFRVFAGLLLVIPGFLSDALALVFLIRPLRVGFGALLLNIFAPLAQRAAAHRYSGNIFEHEGDTAPRGGQAEAPRVIEGELIRRKDDEK